MEPDFYRILGVRETASGEEVKKAYRAAAKKYHPDTNPGDRAAAERFKAALEAYAVIGDEKKRREYDSRRAASVSKGNQPTGSRKPEQSFPSAGFSGMTAGFEQYFGFNPTTREVHKDKLNPNKKTKTNPIDMTEMFERYMGIKKK